MKHVLVSILLTLFINIGNAQNLYFPPLTGSQWDTLSPSAIGICQQPLDSLFAFLDTSNTKAFIILKDGKMVIEKYFGTFTADSVWKWASAGKTITSTLVGIAQHEGFLKISDSTYKYLDTGWTSCSPSAEKAITIRHQLTMTTGLNDFIGDADCTDDTCLKCFAPPGSRWAYHNAPYTLLEKVVESATGVNYNLYFKNKIGDKTGMKGLFLNLGYNKVFFSNARTMARWGLLMLNKGYWGATPVLADSLYYNQMINTSQNINLSYGYLWWLNGKPSYMIPQSQIVFPYMLNPNAPPDAFSGMGQDGQLITIVPSMGIVIVRMGEAPGNDLVHMTYSNQMWGYIKKLNCNVTQINRFNNLNIEIYPNPTNGQNELFIGSEEIDFVEFYSVTGLKINESKLTNRKVNISNFKNGVYIAKFNRNGLNPVIKKIIVSGN